MTGGFVRHFYCIRIADVPEKFCYLCKVLCTLIQVIDALLMVRKGP